MKQANYFISDFYCKWCGSQVAVMVHKHYVGAQFRMVVRCMGCLKTYRVGEDWMEIDITKPCPQNPSD